MNDYIQEKMKVFGNSTFKWVDLEDGNGKYLWHEDVKKYYEKIIREAYTRGIEDALGKIDELPKHTWGDGDPGKYLDYYMTIDGIKSLLPNQENT